MARPRKAKPPPPPSPPKAAAPSLAEALLLATVCMVGLPVEVQVRDGSAYAGVLHTASVDAGYGFGDHGNGARDVIQQWVESKQRVLPGVVLKKAKKIANGKGDANLSLGAYVDTLVIQPDDLVQVIAKDLLLPMKGVCRTLDCSVVTASGSFKPQSSHANDLKMSKTENTSPLKQVDKWEKNTSVKKNAQVSENASSGMSSARCVGPCLSMNGVSGSATVGTKVHAITSSVIAGSTVASDVKSSKPANNLATKLVTSSKTTAKEFRLNPCAKDFSPSFASSRQAVAAVAPINSNYMSHSATEVSTGIPVYESKTLPGVSALSNKIHYNNLPPANYAISPQYVQSIVGHNASRLDPARVGTPYHPMQVGAVYTSPSPQPVMAGKFSPLVYVHPVSQDTMHGTPVSSQGWPCPVFLNPYQASMQKFQGNAPTYVAPPVMATGNLPLVVSSPAPLVQSFHAIHPIMVPAASSMVPGKYM